MKRKSHLMLSFGNGTNTSRAFAAVRFLEQEALAGRLTVGITVQSGLRLIFDLLRQMLTGRRSNATVTVLVAPSTTALAWLNASDSKPLKP